MRSYIKDVTFIDDLLQCEHHRFYLLHFEPNIDVHCDALENADNAIEKVHHESKLSCSIKAVHDCRRRNEVASDDGQNVVGIDWFQKIVSWFIQTIGEEPGELQQSSIAF